MWVWSKLSAVQWADAWEERFFGNPNAVLTHLKGGKSVRVEVYCGSEGEGEGIREQFGGTLRHMGSEAWMNPKVVIGPPLKIRDRIVITQDESARGRRRLEKQFPGRLVISIPAQMAFGTGDHPTTATCLRYLTDEAIRRKGTSWRLLDLGCGSGVLAVAGRLLGAEACEAVDYDPKAVEVARENLARNGVEGVEVREADVLKWRPRRKYAVVAANLFASVLREVIPAVRTVLEPGGRLIVSGVLQDQWEATWEVAEEAGMEVIDHKRRGKWVSGFFGRKGDQ
jgi:ribosomal protein L11 methyltransferase